MDKGEAVKRVKDYIDGVTSGGVVAGRFIKLLVERHNRDLENPLYHFDIDKAIKPILFSGYLKHSKGAWANSKVELEPWECFIIAMVFGWLREDDSRKYRIAYLEVARKNGKTFLAAVVGLYLMIADKEAGAEIYAAATTREQAKIVFDEADRIVGMSGNLKKRIARSRNLLSVPGTATKFMPLGRDSKNLDGLNVHGAIVDELHAHKNSSIWDVLVSGVGNRVQPLIFAITTAGFDLESHCYSIHKYAVSVLEGLIVDEAFFGCIFAMDEGDSWDDKSAWVKANPNLGVTVSVSSLEDMLARARNVDSERTNFKTKHLNMWLTSYQNWISSDLVRACSETIDEESLAGRVCYGGLDLSNTLDITALAYVFPAIGEEKAPIVLVRSWIPQGKLDRRDGKDNNSYEGWSKLGHITIIPGEVIDYDYVYEQIEADRKKFKIREIGYDSWGSSHVYQTVSKLGVEMVTVGQGYRSLSAPMKELERLVASGGIRFSENPVLEWNVRNTVSSSDPAGNVKPDKSKSGDKIDLVVALIMAMNIYMSHSTRAKESVYNKKRLSST